MNTVLHDLHVQRMARQNVIVPEAAASAADEFTCSVCYTNDSSAIVKPKHCIHKICTVCYTNIVLRERAAAKCPECRNLYLKPDEIVSTSPAIQIQRPARLRRYSNNLVMMSMLEHLTRVQSENMFPIAIDAQPTRVDADDDFPMLPPGFTFDTT